MNDAPDTKLTRRQLIRTGLAATTASFVMSGTDFLFPSPAYAQSALNPDEALAQLIAGNKRFTAGSMTHHEQDLNILKQHTEDKQEPFAAVLSCADSRVPVELIFDQSIGHIFVTRVAGNLVTPEIIGSLEYGAAVLGTKVILVMGHSNCGAVKATIEGKSVPGQRRRQVIALGINPDWDVRIWYRELGHHAATTLAPPLGSKTPNPCC